MVNTTLVGDFCRVNQFYDIPSNSIYPSHNSYCMLSLINLFQSIKRKYHFWLHYLILSQLPIFLIGISTSAMFSKTHSLTNSYCILLFISKEQKERYLMPLCSFLLYHCITENTWRRSIWMTVVFLWIFLRLTKHFTFFHVRELWEKENEFSHQNNKTTQKKKKEEIAPGAFARQWLHQAPCDEATNGPWEGQTESWAAWLKIHLSFHIRNTTEIQG